MQCSRTQSNGSRCWKATGPEDRRRIARQVVGHLKVAMPLTNLDGGLIVFAYFAWAAPTGDEPGGWASTTAAALVGSIYFILVAILSNWRARRAEAPLLRWQTDDAPPTDAEREEVLKIPKRMAVMSAQNWAGALPVFFLLNLDHSLQLAIEVAGAMVFAGLATSALAYLVAERITRPALGYVLDPRAPARRGSLGIGPRIILTWAFSTGVPLIAIALIPIGRVPDRAQDLVVPIVFVVVIALVTGLIAMKLSAQAIARPVQGLRDAMDRVREGDIEAEVKVDDASEIGRLQAGFNAMVDGLRERERLRELFGRHVGDDVARVALERGVMLGGERHTVATLFVDVIGSTRLAARESPERVVELLNEFFAAVVDVVAKNHGLVNKFEGDGAVCVFGAPVERKDFAAAALAAARELRERLVALGGLDAAIGVSCGDAVAGNIGAEERYEYTVIGDPVNEAARLREQAKHHPGRVLASATTVEQSGDEESRHWVIDGEVRLRGRSEPTRLAYPRLGAEEPAAAAPQEAAGAA